jgi:prepilin signal peptidase PulO-like enzyme (type II secretory pathway)
VLAWCYLGAKCSNCKTKISPQYVLIELFTAAMFNLLFVLYYLTPPLWGGSYSQMMHQAAFETTWPIYLVNVILISGLIAATLIDFRYFIIPVEIPWFVSVAALILPVATWFMPYLADRNIMAQLWYVPETPMSLVPWIDDFGIFWKGTLYSVPLIGASIGAVLGVGLAKFLVEMGFLPRSFDIYLEVVSENTQNQTQDGAPQDASSPLPATVESGAQTTVQTTEIPKAEPEPDRAVNPAHATAIVIQPAATDQPTLLEPDPYSDQPWPTHPHPRKEVLKEALFLVFPLIGFIVGWFIWYRLLLAFPGLEMGRTGIMFRSLGGVCMGYLVGGGMIWVTRILATLAYGKEAMGLGDVYLLAAIGAVVGPYCAVEIYFLAPFLGLTYALIAFVTSKVSKGVMRVLPYGPALAAATLIIIFLMRGPLG